MKRRGFNMRESGMQPRHNKLHFFVEHCDQRIEYLNSFQQMSRISTRTHTESTPDISSMKLQLLALLTITAIGHCHGFHAPVLSHDPVLNPDGSVNPKALNRELNQCSVVKDIQATRSHEVSNFNVERVFQFLFPLDSARNALLATTYISGPPNLLLALIPSDIDVSSLSLLVSFALGGLLGDVFLHLLPQTFLGEGTGGLQFVLVDEKRNSVLGVFIFVGFIAFFIVDKMLRILDSSESQHSHSHAEKKGSQEGQGRGSSGDLKIESSPSAKASAYLNLISDFTHNITDGLAIAASFYVSHSVGCTTALAVFFHEIPHEIGDFALLIQGGFTKWQAMRSQFVTAIGAYLGTLLGIALQRVPTSALQHQTSAGILGTSVQLSETVLPFTAGGFLYIATVGVVPELLQGPKSVSALVQQLGCAGLGVCIMFLISWFE